MRLSFRNAVIFTWVFNAVAAALIVLYLPWWAVLLAALINMSSLALIAYWFFPKRADDVPPEGHHKVNY